MNLSSALVPAAGPSVARLPAVSAAAAPAVFVRSGDDRRQTSRAASSGFDELQFLRALLSPAPTARRC